MTLTKSPGDGGFIAAPPGLALHRLFCAAAVALVLALRLVRLHSYPPIEADEGGWPLAVRQWVEEGLREGDYYMSPGYHWLLGGIFRLFGATHEVSRPATALVGLLGLWLFHRLALRLSRSTSVAFWATLLLGTSYLGVLIDRRAFMEPFVVTLMLGLCLAVTGPGQSIWRLGSVAVLTALLLLTKITGGFILPPLALWALWPSDGPEEPRGAPRWRLATALAGGTALAAAVFWSIYASDPAPFLQAWAEAATESNLLGAEPAKRFAFSPKAIERTLRWYAQYEPIQFGLAIAAWFQAVFGRRQIIMAGWLALGLMWLAIQLYIQSNHYVVLVAPICYFSALFLEQLHRDALKLSRAVAWQLSWVRAVQMAMVLYAAARLTTGIAGGSLPDGAAVQWLAAHTDARSRVMAAPNVLMRLRAQPVSFWRLPRPFLPTPEAVRQWDVGWLVTEPLEWEHHHGETSHGDLTALHRTLAECCELAYATPGASVWRVRNRGPSPIAQHP